MFPTASFWLILAYLGINLGLLVWRIQKRKDREGRFPLGDDIKLIRRAGESLERRAARLDEQITDAFCWGAFIPLALAMPPLLLARWFPDSWSLGWLVSSAALFIAGVTWGVSRLVRLTTQIRQTRLGLYGERVVADQLDELKHEGFRVIHDVPCLGGTGPFNIDHVVIGGGGVAVIDTKTRRKTAPTEGQSDYKVTFDGISLHWPNGSTSRGAIDQIIRNAEWLQKRLKSELDIDATILPIVVIPGWWVEARAKRPVVVNQKNLPDVIRHQCRGLLMPAQQDLISRHLASMCRDVEFDGAR